MLWRRHPWRQAMAFARSVEGEWLFYNSHWWCFCNLLYNVYATSFQKSASTSGSFRYRAWWAGLRIECRVSSCTWNLREPMDQFGGWTPRLWLVKPQMFLSVEEGMETYRKNPIDDHRRLGRLAIKRGWKSCWCLHHFRESFSIFLLLCISPLFSPRSLQLLSGSL